MNRPGLFPIRRARLGSFPRPSIAGGNGTVFRNRQPCDLGSHCCADLAKFRIPLPPTKAEQEAIAEALSDADEFIESLEQLIAKKRHLKQLAGRNCSQARSACRASAGSGR
jgi:hypothetical protein